MRAFIAILMIALSIPSFGQVGGRRQDSAAIISSVVAEYERTTTQEERRAAAEASRKALVADRMRELRNLIQEGRTSGAHFNFLATDIRRWATEDEVKRLEFDLNPDRSHEQ